jgi:hypothetical protein
MIVDFEERGGISMTRLRISRRLTASRWVQTASMCHPGTKGVVGSRRARPA